MGQSRPHSGEAATHHPLETIVSVNMIDAMPPLQKYALKLPIPTLMKKRDALTAPAPNTIPWQILTGSALGGQGEDIVSCPEVNKDSVALILYTSGTTGAPKGLSLPTAASLPTFYRERPGSRD